MKNELVDLEDNVIQRLLSLASWLWILFGPFPSRSVSHDDLLPGLVRCLTCQKFGKKDESGHWTGVFRSSFIRRRRSIWHCIE